MKTPKRKNRSRSTKKSRKVRKSRFRSNSNKKVVHIAKDIVPDVNIELDKNTSMGIVKKAFITVIIAALLAAGASLYDMNNLTNIVFQNVHQNITQSQMTAEVNMPEIVKQVSEKIPNVDLPTFSQNLKGITDLEIKTISKAIEKNIKESKLTKSTFKLNKNIEKIIRETRDEYKPKYTLDQYLNSIRNFEEKPYKPYRYY